MYSLLPLQIRVLLNECVCFLADRAEKVLVFFPRRLRLSVDTLQGVFKFALRLFRYAVGKVAVHFLHLGVRLVECRFLFGVVALFDTRPRFRRQVRRVQFLFHALVDCGEVVFKFRGGRFSPNILYLLRRVPCGFFFRLRRRLRFAFLLCRRPLRFLNFRVECPTSAASAFSRRRLFRAVEKSVVSVGNSPPQDIRKRRGNNHHLVEKRTKPRRGSTRESADCLAVLVQPVLEFLQLFDNRRDHFSRNWDERRAESLPQGIKLFIHLGEAVSQFLCRFYRVKNRLPVHRAAAPRVFVHFVEHIRKLRRAASKAGQKFLCLPDGLRVPVPFRHAPQLFIVGNEFSRVVCQRYAKPRQRPCRFVARRARACDRLVKAGQP